MFLPPHRINQPPVSSKVSEGESLLHPHRINYVRPSSRVSVLGYIIVRLKRRLSKLCFVLGTPANTVLGYQACICGLRGWPRRFCDAFRLRPHPKGRRDRPLLAITQARNTSAIIAAMTPRGCREPCWAPGSGDRSFSSG